MIPTIITKTTDNNIIIYTIINLQKEREEMVRGFSRRDVYIMLEGKYKENFRYINIIIFFRSNQA